MVGWKSTLTLQESVGITDKNLFSNNSVFMKSVQGCILCVINNALGNTYFYMGNMKDDKAGFLIHTSNQSYGTLKFSHVCIGKPCICNGMRYMSHARTWTWRPLFTFVKIDAQAAWLHYMVRLTQLCGPFIFCLVCRLPCYTLSRIKKLI